MRPAYVLLALVCLVSGRLLAQPPSEDDLEFKRGAALAKVHCQLCHLLPSPSLYDQRTWEKHTLPWMSTKLGLKPVDTAKLPGGKFVEAAKIFPATPMISEADWKSICRYYQGAAPAMPLPQDPRPEIKLDLQQFTVVPAAYRQPTPFTTLVKIVPERRQLFVGDSLRRTLYLLDPQGQEVNSIGTGLPPVALEVRPDGLLVTLIGYVAPSDDPIGRLLFIPTTATGSQRPTVLLDHLPRPCDTDQADLNGDGRDDFVVSCFGNLIGRFPWFERLDNGQFREHVLFDRPGATCAHVQDFNRDGLPDVLVLMAQAREGIYLFSNQGKGDFHVTPLVDQPPAWGYAALELADFNLDGHVDLLASNGDNAEYPTPMKRYHGVRIYLNNGRNEFREAYCFPLNGAYKAVARDFDQDGDLDIAAISFFPDYLKSPEESFVFLENQGGLRFTAHSLAACTAGRWIVMDAADLDGDGDDDIVLGAFNQGPETIPIPAGIRDQWKAGGPSVLILKNTRR